jgi:hypothetical protein
MAYATPTTPSEFTALIDGISWTPDCNRQKAKVVDLMARLEALFEGWNTIFPVSLHIVQDDPPSMNDWQIAWVDSGRELPMTGTITGLWETMTGTKAAAHYLFIEGEMRPAMSHWWNGSSDVLIVPQDALLNHAFTSGQTDAVNWTLPLDRDAYFEGTFGITRVGNSGAEAAWSTNIDTALGINRTGTMAADITGIPPAGTVRIHRLRWYGTARIPALSSVFKLSWNDVTGSATQAGFKHNVTGRKFESGSYFNPGEVSAMISEVIYL